jgi:type IV pilus assembly protein PilN
MQLFGKKKDSGEKKKPDEKAFANAPTPHKFSKINLLPWREKQRKEREIRFYTMMGIGLAISALIFLGVHLYFQARIDVQKMRNDYLRAEIKKAEEQIKEIKRLKEKKENLFQRMEVIKNLQQSRPEVVYLFDELVKTLPDGVYYKNLTQNNKVITLNGQAQSDARVSTLMRNLDDSDWFQSPSLQFTRIDGRLKTFSLVVKQDIPEEMKKKKKEDEE